MIQSEAHKCEEMPDVRISKMRIDGNWLGWCLYLAAISKEMDISGSIRDIRYCPYCGKELK